MLAIIILKEHLTIVTFVTNTYLIIKKLFFYFFYMCLFTIFILDIYYLKAKTLFGHMM